jgi:hypothetical protein
MIPKVLYAFKS